MNFEDLLENLLSSNVHVVSQLTLSQLFDKCPKFSFIKKTPVCLIPFKQLQYVCPNDNTFQKIISLLGKIDNTHYNDNIKSNSFVVMQMKDNEPDIYLASEDVMVRKYTEYNDALPKSEEQILKIPSLCLLKYFNIDTNLVNFYVKKIPTVMVNAEDAGVQDKTIEVSWDRHTVSTQHVDTKGFLVKEDDGHIYTVAADSNNMPIGYMQCI